MRAGAPKPDIGSADALKRTLLAAKTVGYTSGPSGVYMAGLIERMGIAAEIKPKFRSVPSGGTIGTIVASGECEIGFQQVSELVHIKGIDYVGPLPPDVQRVTVFSTGIPGGRREPGWRQGAGQVPHHARRRRGDRSGTAWNRPDRVPTAYRPLRQRRSLSPRPNVMGGRP